MTFKIIGVALAVSLACGVAMADDQPSLEDVVAQLQAMQQRIDALEGQLEVAKSISAPASPSTDDIRAIIQEQMAAAPGTVPAWLDNLTFAGKIRLRHEWRGKEESAAGVAGTAGDERNRFRYLLVFGFEKAMTEELTVGFELASGDWDNTVRGGAPTSSNETMGDSFLKDPIFINRVYMVYKPSNVEGLTVTAGKFKNTFDTVKAGHLWDSDVTPEGVLVRYDVGGCETVQPWVQAAYLIVTENTTAAAPKDDSDIMALQVGAKGNVADGVTATGAATYYHFSDFEDTTLNSNGPPTGFTTPTNFKVIELAGEVGFNAVDLPCSVFADWAHNMDQEPAPGSNDCAWKAGVRVGKAKEVGDWGFQYDYSYVDLNAFTDEWADADHGFVNYRGHTAKVNYRVFNNTTLGLTVYCLDDLHDVAASDSFIMTQLDVTTTF